MARPHEELLHRLYDVFARRDQETVRSLVTEGAVLHQPGRNPLSGDYMGDAIDEFWA